MNTSAGYQVSGTAADNYERTASAFMLPWARNLAGHANLQQGDRVLDLACGTGFVARTAAELVGPDGAVTALDINPTMLAVARTIANFDTLEAPADATGLETGSFDVVLCQQGLQYFPDPAAALTESRRLLRPGGRAHFSIWASFTDNPFIASQLNALEPHLDPDAIAAFRRTNIDALGGSRAVRHLLADTGFTSLTTTTERLTIDLPPMRDYFPRLIAATPWAATYAELTTAERDAVLDRIEQAVSPTAAARASTVRMTAVIFTGHAP